MEDIRENFIENFNKNRPYPNFNSFDVERDLKNKLVHNTWGEIYRNIVENIKYAINDNIIINAPMENIREDIQENYYPPSEFDFYIKPHLSNKLMNDIWGKINNNIEKNIKNAINLRSLKKQNKWKI